MFDRAGALRDAIGVPPLAETPVRCGARGGRDDTRTEGSHFRCSLGRATSTAAAAAVEAAEDGDANGTQTHRHGWRTPSPWST
jgi:hypothetical protein